jgi:hypothetical protein
VRADREGLAVLTLALSREANMTVRRYIHHDHSGWPSPYVGVIAAVLFGIVVMGVFSMLLWLTR